MKPIPRLSLCLLILLGTSCTDQHTHDKIRIATFNIAMGLSGEGELAERLNTGNDPDLARVAEILQRVRPDIVLLNEFDHTPTGANLLRQNYLAKSWSGQPVLNFGHIHARPVNTGVDSGLDLNRNGQTGEPEDAWGYGRFPGQYGMLVLSRFPVDVARTRSFRNFRWRDMPGALRPVLEDGQPYYPDAVWQQLKLSSKSHWDVALQLGETTLHFLVSHPTPSVFDGPEDRNGRRNHDEIRLWADYVAPPAAAYLADDGGRRGGLPQDVPFVIAGDLNADPLDGDTTDHAIRQLLDHPRIDASCVPTSRGGAEAASIQGGANLEHRGDPAADTADFNDARAGNLRVDYVLPSRGLKVLGCGVYWPAAGEAGHELVSVSDHRLVWIDIELATSR